MPHVELISYYTGHGGLYYAEVQDDVPATALHLIVDAGTNPTASDPNQVATNLQDIVQRIAARPAQVIVCLTHAHLDHYSHLGELLDSIASLTAAPPYRVYVTPRPSAFTVQHSFLRANIIPELFDPLKSMTASNSVFNDILTRHQPQVRLLDACQNGRETLFSIPRTASLDRLFSWMDSGYDENRNGTLFSLSVGGALIWFTGDITGETMRWLIEDSPQAATDIQARAAAATSVAITVPHHGSVHTLEEGGFIYYDPDQGNDSPLSASSFDDFFQLLCGGKLDEAFVAADFQDQYGHPDSWTLYFLMQVMNDSAVAHDSIGYKHVPGEYDTIADTKAHVAGGYYWDTYRENKNLHVTWGMTNPNNAGTVFYLNPSVVM